MSMSSHIRARDPDFLSLDRNRQEENKMLCVCSDTVEHLIKIVNPTLNGCFSALTLILKYSCLWFGKTHREFLKYSNKLKYYQNMRLVQVNVGNDFMER